jgi:hypothetical protein
MYLLLKMLLCSVVNGVTAEAELNTRRAADGRHPPFITAFTLPATHTAWPEGTLMIAGDATGSATAASAEDTDIIGVLETRVDADEQSGNVVIHGSVPADILKCEDGGGLVKATAEHINALRGIGIYV